MHSRLFSMVVNDLKERDIKGLQVQKYLAGYVKNDIDNSGVK